MLSVLECDGEIPATFFYNFYAGILYGGTKSKDCDHDENWKRFNSRVDVRRKIFAVYMACRDDFMPFVSSQYNIEYGKKEYLQNVKGCKKIPY